MTNYTTGPRHPGSARGPRGVGESKKKTETKHKKERHGRETAYTVAVLSDDVYRIRTDEGGAQ